MTSSRHSRRKFEQLPLPLGSPIPPETVKNLIEDKYKDSCTKVFGEPKYDIVKDEWIATTAVTPTGPLVVAAFKISFLVNRLDT